MIMVIIKASEFKAKCLKLMDEVAETGQDIVITKHGKPVSRLVPYRSTPDQWFGALRDTIEITGDIVSSTGEVWEVEK